MEQSNIINQHVLIRASQKYLDILDVRRDAFQKNDVDSTDVSRRTRLRHLLV